MTMTDLIMAGASRSDMAARLVSLCWRPDVECYYYGYAAHGGHVLVGAAASRYDYDMLSRALDRPLDGGLCCWRDRQTEGQALLTHGGGWTAIAFWDRSDCPRPYSNTAFIVRGTLTFEQMIRVARHQHPLVWRRFTFPVVQVGAQGTQPHR